MSDPHAEILTGGPGDPADRSDHGDRLYRGAPAGGWQPGGAADRLEVDGSEGWEPAEDGDEPGAARSGVWRGLLRGVLGPESLALTGLVLAILPLLGRTVLGWLAAAVAVKDNGTGEWYPESGDDLATATGGFSAAMALFAVFLGVLALRHADTSRRATVGMAGAAVLVGVVGAALHLLTLAAGPAVGFW